MLRRLLTLAVRSERAVRFAKPIGQTRVIVQQAVRSPTRDNLREAVTVPQEPQERFLLLQLLDGVAPEKAWAERESVIKRIELAGTLDRGDEFTARAIAGWAEDLAHVLESKEANLLVPLFSELFAAKMLRAMDTERRNTYLMQRQAASDARSYLFDCIHALSAHVQGGTPTSEKTIGGITGLAQRLEMRYQAQIKACDVEVYRATAFLKEIEGTDAPSRSIEVAMAAQEAELETALARVVESLRQQSMQVMLRQRDEANNLEAIA